MRTIFRRSARAAAIAVALSSSVALAQTFVDVPVDAWFTPYVHEAAQLGIVSGYKDAKGNLTGYFGPGNNVTIAEALKMSELSAGWDPTVYTCVFDGNDERLNHWACQYFGLALTEHFSFVPKFAELDRAATRAEVASLIGDAFHVMQDVAVSDRYIDVTGSTAYAVSIEALSRDGVLSGDTDASGQPIHRFRPLDSVNRAETVKMIIRARSKYGTPARSSAGAASSVPSSASSMTSSVLSSASSAMSSASASSMLSSSSGSSIPGSSASSSASSL